MLGFILYVEGFEIQIFKSLVGIYSYILGFGSIECFYFYFYFILLHLT